MSKFIILNKRQICDFELITNGAFHPLDGFMNKRDYWSCLGSMITSKGFFPIPITLSISIEKSNELQEERTVILKDETGFNLGIMDISYENSIYSFSHKTECKQIFGCYDLNHPYIQILEKQIDDGLVYNIGGPIIKYEKVLHYDFKDLRLTPQETKDFFKEKGWTNIIGFQTRNPMHRSHYELTKRALSEVPDGKLLIHPVVGITQDCDIDYYTRVKCYQRIMFYYGDKTTKLSLLPLSMRMAGPREALLHALIRKNYGCTHFIVGRDHAGPSCKRKDGSSFYKPYEAQELLLKYADVIGIKPIISKEIVCVVNAINYFRYITMDEYKPEYGKISNISGTEFRRMIKEGEEIPIWYSYYEVIEELRKNNKTNGICIYFIGLSGSGKSTLANYLMVQLKEKTGRTVSLLDGDIIRNNLSKGLGFSREDRSTNVRRIGYVASEIVKHNGVVICANIAPYEEDRKYNNKLISEYGTYIEIYVNTPLEICEERDCKGLYKLAREGKIKQFTGISDPFEEPTSSTIIINGGDDIDKNLKDILLITREYL